MEAGRINHATYYNFKLAPVAVVSLRTISQENCLNLQKKRENLGLFSCVGTEKNGTNNFAYLLSTARKTKFRCPSASIRRSIHSSPLITRCATIFAFNAHNDEWLLCTLYQSAWKRKMHFAINVIISNKKWNGQKMGKTEEKKNKTNKSERLSFSLTRIAAYA